MIDAEAVDTPATRKCRSRIDRDYNCFRLPPPHGQPGGTTRTAA